MTRSPGRRVPARLVPARLVPARLVPARLVPALLVAALLLGLAGPAGAAAPPTPAGPVVVIGVAGLRWSDVGPHTPALSALARTGAVGVLSVKALPEVSCPADGWLTLGAGARAQAYGAARRPCDASLAGDPRDGPRNAGSRDGARLGALAEALGGFTPDGPGAVLAAGSRAAAGQTVGAAPTQVVVVDAGTVAGPDRVAGARAADAALAVALAGRDPDTDVLVVGLSEAPGEDVAHLHVAAAVGPSFPRGALSSASTRRAPYVQLIDVAPTVLALTGRPAAPVMDGQPWSVRGPAPTVAELVDLDRLAVTAKRVTVPFFVVVLALEVGLLLALRHRPRPARLVALGGVTVLGASYAANLLPWWRAPSPLAALLAASLALAAAGVLLAARTRRPVGVACAGVAVLLAVDLLTGARLQIGSVAGYSALVAGRFAGIGNVAFGVYAAAALLGTALLAGAPAPRRRLPALLAAGLLAVVVDGAPPWGSDVGGVLALLPAFAVLALQLTGRRVSLLRVGAAGLAAAAVVTAFAAVDAARPAEQRTHLGRFARQVVDGTAGEVLARKAEATLGLLFRSPVTALLPLVVAAAVWLVLRPPAPLRDAFAEEPGLRPGLLAVGVASALGFALNDSGAAVPALALALAVPATVAVVSGVAWSRRAGRAG